MTTGVIGLGGIGLAMALKLLEAGHDVLGYQRGATEAFEAAGGRRAASARAVAEETGVVFTALPSAAALDDVAAALAAAGRDGLVVVETSMLAIEDKERARATLREAGGDLLDAPVSGNPEMLRARQGVFFVSGEEAGFEQARPAFDALGDVAVFAGPFGDGTKLKLLANLLVGIHTAAAGEALALAEGLGLDLARAVEALTPSAGGSVMLGLRGAEMAAGRFGPVGGTVVTFCKTLEEVRDAVEETGAATPLLDTATRLYDEAIETGRGDEDIAVVMEVLRARRGPR